jgi:MFS superfamily sulfate permease-like transporter
MQQYIPWVVTALALVALVLLLGWQNLAAARHYPSGPSPLPASWDLVPRPVFSVD